MDQVNAPRPTPLQEPNEPGRWRFTGTFYDVVTDRCPGVPCYWIVVSLCRVS